VAELLRLPAQFDAATATLGPEDLEGHVLMSSDPDRYVQALAEYRAMGFEEIYRHNFRPNQQ
jgi:coenzyme F420-dependent glucose-6-phosphate dehydrogenase